MRKNQLAQFSNMIGPRRVPPDAEQTRQLFERACVGQDLVGTFAGPVRPLPIQPIGQPLNFKCHPLQFVSRAGSGRKRGLLPGTKAQANDRRDWQDDACAQYSTLSVARAFTCATK